MSARDATGGWGAAIPALARACGLTDAALAGDIARAVAERGPDPLIPGAVYEARLADDRTRRRAGGAYYTPPHLVDFTVEQTIGRALAGRSSEQALALRVLDPACGGGAFLIAALARIERHVRERQADGGDRDGAIFDADDAGSMRGRDLRRAIVARCLFGVDIDPRAVALTRLALALALAIDCDGDGVGDPGEADRARETAGAGARADRAAVCEASVRLADSLLDDLGGLGAGFDAVVGNPPWGQKGVRFPDESAAALRARYTCATGPLDPFKLFVERALELTRVGGRWGMVLPDIVLLKDQRPVRDLIRTRSAIEWIADCGRAFPGVNLDAVVIVGRRVRDCPPRGHVVSIWRELPGDWRVRPPATHALPQRVFGELPGHRFNIHLTPASLRLVRRLAALPTLGDVFEIHEGVHSGNARGKLFLPAPTGPACAKLIVGRRELTRYRLAWAGAWLCRDPAALDRAAGEYANLGRPEWHERKKLVVRRTGDRIVAAYDRHGYWVSNNMFVVVARRSMSASELRAYVALLSSAAMTWYFRTVQPRTGKLFAELKIEHLRAFPRPPEAAWAALVPDLAALVRRLERAPRPGGRREAAAEAADQAAIDAAIARLFALTPAEARLVAGV